MATTIVLIQDPSSTNNELAAHFSEYGYRLESTPSVDGAIKLLDDNGVKPGAILVDVPDLSEKQMQLLETLDENLPFVEWVFLTYQLDDDLYDRLEDLSFRNLEQPCSLKRVDAAVRKAIRSTMAQRQLKQFSQREVDASSFDSIVGDSAIIKQHRQNLQQLAKVPLSTLFIKGETGTGKGHAARILHRNGLRAENAFVEMNCAALPSELVESQLFGHEAGAFTGAKGRYRGFLEQADSGTLFLDEIGEMPLDVQAKLLKAIEEQRFRRLGGEHEIEVDVQIYAASNQDLQTLVIDGLFREDLYHRLNVFEIEVPPLRSYREDLVTLVPAIIAEFSLRSGKKVSHISDDAWAQLQKYEWPGNVRELRNALERGVLLATDDSLNTDWLNLNNDLLAEQLEMDSETDNIGPVVDALNPGADEIENRTPGDQKHELRIRIDGSTSLDEIDRQVIERALELSNNNVSAAAELVGTTRETLRYRIQKHQLDKTA